MIRADKQDGKRLTIATLVALLLHGATFVGFVYLSPLVKGELPEYGGQVTVTIGSSESVAPESPPVSEPRASEPRVSAPAAAAPAPRSAAVKAPGSTPVRETPRVETGRNTVLQVPAERRKSSSGYEEPVPLEQVADLKRAPDTPPAVDLPKLEEKGGKETPFVPGTQVEDMPLAVDLGKLDKAIAAGTGEPAEDFPKGQAAVKGQTEAKGKPGASASGRTVETPREGAGTASGGDPLITWDRGTEERKLSRPAPKPVIPQWVQREGLKLKVIVTFSVTPEGHTTDVDTEDPSSGYPDVDAAVLDAVRNMMFEAAPGAPTARGTVTYIIGTK